MEPDAGDDPDDGAPTDDDASTDHGGGAGSRVPAETPTEQFLDGYVPI